MAQVGPSKLPRGSHGTRGSARARGSGVHPAAPPSPQSARPPAPSAPAQLAAPKFLEHAQLVPASGTLHDLLVHLAQVPELSPAHSDPDRALTKTPPLRDTPRSRPSRRVPRGPEVGRTAPPCSCHRPCDRMCSLASLERDLEGRGGSSLSFRAIDDPGLWHRGVLS